jgi:hypothetical protein
MTQSAELHPGALAGALSRKPRARRNRPTRARQHGRPEEPTRSALLPELPLRHAVASLEHWLDLNA